MNLSLAYINPQRQTLLLVDLCCKWWLNAIENPSILNSCFLSQHLDPFVFHSATRYTPHVETETTSSWSQAFKPVPHFPDRCWGFIKNPSLFLRHSQVQQVPLTLAGNFPV